MILTAKPGKGTKIHICVDGEYRVTVDADFWYLSGHTSGEELDEETLEAFLQKAAENSAYQRALRLLAGRSHSKKELVEKLARKGEGRGAQAAAARVESLGLLDEAQFARQYAENAALRKYMADRRIHYELSQKGIDDETIQETLAALELSEEERIEAYLAKKNTGAQKTEKEIKRIFDTLVRLGYAYSDIRRAMQSIQFDYEVND